MASPYERARHLHGQAIPPDQIEKTLIAEGIDAESARIVVQALRAPGDATTDFGPPDPMPAVAAPAPRHPCPTHSDFPVTGSCTRCGKFFCGKCVQAAQLPEAASETRCPECRLKFPAAPSFSGWLLLPALHLGMAIVGSVWALATDIRALTGPMAEAFVVPVAIEAAVALARLSFSGVVAVNFFKKKKRAIALCIGFYFVNMAYAAFDFGMAQWSEELTGLAAADSGLRGPVLSVAASVLWITYFLQSKQVRATLVVE